LSGPVSVAIEIHGKAFGPVLAPLLNQPGHFQELRVRRSVPALLDRLNELLGVKALAGAHAAELLARPLRNLRHLGVHDHVHQIAPRPVDIVKVGAHGNGKGDVPGFLKLLGHRHELGPGLWHPYAHLGEHLLVIENAGGNQRRSDVVPVAVRGSLPIVDLRHEHLAPTLIPLDIGIRHVQVGIQAQDPALVHVLLGEAPGEDEQVRCCAGYHAGCEPRQCLRKMRVRPFDDFDLDARILLHVLLVEGGQVAGWIPDVSLQPLPWDQIIG
jgi:hypothetical protein